MINLIHNQRVIFQNYRGTIGTARGYAKEYYECPDKAEHVAIERDQEIAWVMKDSSGLTSDREYNRKRNESWLSATKICEDDVVEIEGKQYTIRYNGNYSDFITFIPRG